MDPTAQTLIDGEPVGADDLSPLAFAGFAHFTAMQVRAGGVRGLDLHLDRLQHASRELFGVPAPGDVRARIRQAVEGAAADLSLTVTIFDASGEFTPGPPALRVLVRTAPPSDGPAGPLRLATRRHERFLPSVKHVGEGAKTLLLRQAVGDGFDDVAFTDGSGHLSEASIWNLAFLSGSTIVWPAADVLRGTTLAVLQRRLDQLGVDQRTQPVTVSSLGDLDAAVVMNSWTPAVPVSRIGSVDLPDAMPLVQVLREAWAAEPLVEP